MTADQEHIRQSFLAELARLESWLSSEQIPYAIVGSLAVSAYVDQGRSIDFNRPHAYDETQRMPDIDLLIPRESNAKLQSYAEDSRRNEFPVNVETVDAYIDFRSDTERSYLTHRKLQFPVATELFEPRKATLLGQQITTIDPRTLLHTFGTIGGVIRKKDVPKIVGLAEAIKSGVAVSRFSERDCEVFSRYMVARKRQYPVFVGAKRTWEGVLEALPPKATQAIKHHILPAAHQAMGQLNRDRRQTNRDRER